MTTNYTARACLMALPLCFASTGCGDPGTNNPVEMTPVSPTTSVGVSPSATSTVSPTGTLPPSPGVQPVPSACISTVGADNNLVLPAQEANNYWFTSDFQPRDVVVKSGSELHFDWTGLTQDFLGHPVNAQAPIDMVVVVKWRIPRAEMLQKLNEDSLDQESAFGAIAHYPNGNTTASLFEFGIPGGEPLSPEEILEQFQVTEGSSFSVMPSQGDEPGKGIRAIKTLTLDPNSQNTQVILDTDPADLTYQTDLTSLSPVSVPAGNSAITVDWSGMTVNGLGAEFRDRHINNVLVGHYSLSLEELENQFLDLEYIADGMWQGTVEAGEKFALSDLVNADGSPFPGIDTTGNWILALQCKKKCGNPAPWYLTRLVPCTQ